MHKGQGLWKSRDPLSTGSLVDMQHTILRDASILLQPEVIKLSQWKNSSWALIVEDSPFMDTMKALINISSVFQGHYGIGLVYPRTKDIMNFMMSS